MNDEHMSHDHKGDCCDHNKDVSSETPVVSVEESPVGEGTEAQSTPVAKTADPAWKLFLKTPKGMVIAGVVGILVLGGILTNQVYARPVTDGLVRNASAVIPYPALKVNGDVVTIKEFLIEYDALSHYFAELGQEAPPVDQLEIAISDTLVNKMVIEQLARQYGVELDEERVESYYQDVLSGQESEEAFQENLMKTFEWSPEEFREHIVKSIVLALQVTDTVLADETVQQDRSTLINSAFERVQAGEDFNLVATDVRAGFDGAQTDLGYVKSSVIPETWSSAVSELEIGQTTEVLDLTEGYVIFKVEDKIVVEDETQLHLLSITVPKRNLEEVVNTYLETAQVKKYVGQE